MDLGGGRFGEEALHELVGVEVPMAREAVEAVQFHVFLEVGQAGEALEGGFFHARDVLEAHMVVYQGDDLFDFFVGEAVAATNGLGHFDADLDVMIEADAVAGLGRGFEGGRFADIVEQGATSESRRGTGA